MADVLNVNPTRMELGKLKKRLVSARRGHKLLKDKCDEMMKTFLESVRENKELRLEVGKALENVHASFSAAAAVTSDAVLEESLIYPTNAVGLDVSYKNILSVNVPYYTVRETGSTDNRYGYGFAFTSAELDDAVDELNGIMPKLLQLAACEKKSQMLADEIEKTRRRVNALEYSMIPQLENTIKVINMKLGENERGNLTRLMKVKDMMLEKARKEAL